MRTFATYHPSVLLLYFSGVALITALTFHPFLLAFSFLGAFLWAGRLESGKAVVLSLGFYVPLFLLLALINPLFSHNGVTPLFFLNDNPVTLEAVLYGAAIAGMMVSILYWGRCYSQVMTSDKFIYLFGKAIPKLSLFLSIALRFCPLFLKQMKKIHQTQRTMGLYATESVVDRLRGRMRVFAAILTWSLEHAVDSAAAMRARGYGLPGRTNFSRFRFTLGDLALLGLLVLLFGWTALGFRGGSLRFAFYPGMSELELSWYAKANYGGVLILMLLPFLSEVKETILWNYFRSKI
ncbi:energy-coupling factor transporter transmembrane component T [Desulfosporosinus sp. PR]|uniref:energy-coupling factor transporter transmembrane component T n=1 Tax=Candidatus Desulfosporosinus nitrosoreducens TaxID=3401928 RepID=UPI0027FEC0B7|nr:energy-coupling factor transporter transmembrane component T [Desulfosporosinus sp. PR]MDQ7094892.1 energy-coupling factor transporter transmembrane component T [Desulfosporosinus sp. PR]